MANGSEFGARHGRRRPLFGFLCCSSPRLCRDGMDHGGGSHPFRMAKRSRGLFPLAALQAPEEPNRSSGGVITRTSCPLTATLHYTSHSISGFNMAATHSSHFPQFLCRYRLTPTRLVLIPQHNFLVLVLVLVLLLLRLRRPSALHSSINFLFLVRHGSQPSW